MNKYGHVLAQKTSYHRRRQMFQIHLWMQLDKEMKDLQLTGQDLARVVGQG